MSAEQQIEKLQSLLERVRRNATRSRPRRPVAAAAPGPAPVVDEPVEKEGIEDVELLEDDIIDLTVEEVGAEVVVPPGPEFDEDIFFEDEEEEREPPASSRRPKVAASMDEALAGAAGLEFDESREVPLKTPPPESGPHITAPPSHALRQSAPPADPDADVDEPLEADISSGTQHAKPAAPITEQLGQTAELEEGPGEELELEDLVAPAPESGERDDLEAPFPSREVHGSYAEPLARPLAPPAAPASGKVEPEVVERPAVAASAPPVAEIVVASREFRPQSFVELLDASLALGE